MKVHFLLSAFSIPFKRWARVMEPFPRNSDRFTAWNPWWPARLRVVPLRKQLPGSLEIDWVRIGLA